MFMSGIQKMAGLAQPMPRRVGRGSGGFGLPVADLPAPGVEGAPPIVAGLVLQEEDRRARPPARSILEAADSAIEAFAAMQIGLLAAGIRDHAAAALHDAANLPPAEDPRLEEILQSIRLRARVELAREQAAKVVMPMKTAMDQAFGASFPAQNPLGMQPGPR